MKTSHPTAAFLRKLQKFIPEYVDARVTVKLYADDWKFEVDFDDMVIASVWKGDTSLDLDLYKITKAKHSVRDIEEWFIKLKKAWEKEYNS